MVKYSIIIPVYNCEKYIKECLYSVLNQSFKNLEIIVVNDGSTDDTLEICKQLAYTDSRIKVFDIKNSGVSNARNFGVSKATGEYIHFVDADDSICEGLYEYANTILDEEVELLRFNYQFVNLNKHFSNNEFNYEKDTYITRDVLLSEVIPKILSEKIKAYVWQIIIKKESVKKFDTELKILEDENFYLSILPSLKKCFFTNKIFYNYNISNTDSATRDGDKMVAMMNNMILANKKLKSTLTQFNLDTKDNLEILDSRMAHSFSHYLELLYLYYNSFSIAKEKFEVVVSQYNLKYIFKNRNCKKLNLKHNITTFLTLNKQYILLNGMYRFKHKLKNVIEKNN